MRAQRVDQLAPVVGLALRFARVPQVLQVRVGLALGHVAPAALFEQPLHEGIDVGDSDVVRDLPELFEALMVMGLDRLGAALQILEGVVVGG